MGDILFITALAVYLAAATALLYRNPTHGWGFPMFVLIYPLFLAAFLFASSRTVVTTWLVLAVLNMPVQVIGLKRQAAQSNPTGVLIASLFLWPVQLAAMINSTQTAKEEQENKATNRAKLGELPATITGRVSYTHHIGTEAGHDTVWFEEFGDLDFLTDSKTYDRIGIAEGKTLSVRVEERDAPSDLATGKVLWIVDAG